MACVKKAYPNKAAAERRAANHSVEVGYPLYVYQCYVCLKWHLTKKRPAKRSFKSKVTKVRRKRNRR
jgi:hypothetical protein